MQKQFTIAISLLAGASLASAQSGQLEFKWAAEKMDKMDAKTVIGAPYTAKAVTTSTQTLADGTKITHNITALLSRDSSGRTRGEQSIDMVGPWSTDVNEHVIYIRDPLLQKMFTLRPADQRAVVTPLDSEQNFKDWQKAKLDAEKRFRYAQENDLAAKKRAMAKEGMYVAHTDPANVSQDDDLGEQVIEGVRVTGKRETQTIPVGKVGNDRPLKVVSEIWYSDELQAVILSKHSDPRVGETEYRLTEISRTEPPHSAFEVPAGYTVIDKGAYK